jgi:hypothetical protein
METNKERENINITAHIQTGENLNKGRLNKDGSKENKRDLLLERQRGSRSMYH